MHSVLDGGEGVIGPVAPEFFVACRFFELSVGLGGIEYDVSMELHGVRHGMCHVFDADLVLFVNGKRDWIWGMIFPHDPDGQFCQIEGINELSEGRPAAPDGEGRAFFLGLVAFVNEPGYDVTVVYAEVVVRSVDVGGYDAGEVASVFFLVSIRRLA